MFGLLDRLILAQKSLQAVLVHLRVEVELRDESVAEVAVAHWAVEDFVAVCTAWS